MSYYHVKQLLDKSEFLIPSNIFGKLTIISETAYEGQLPEAALFRFVVHIPCGTNA